MKFFFFWGGGSLRNFGGGVEKNLWEGLRKICRKIWGGGWLTIFVGLRKFKGVEKFSGRGGGSREILGGGGGMWMD